LIDAELDGDGSSAFTLSPTFITVSTALPVTLESEILTFEVLDGGEYST